MEEDYYNTHFTGEDKREHFLIMRGGYREAAKWYIKTARIYRDSAISYSEKVNRDWANTYISAAVECLSRGIRLRNKSNSNNSTQ
jgi:hypothetical protein